MMARLSFISGCIAFVRILYCCIVFYCRNCLVFKAILLKKRSLSVKSKCHGEKMRMRLNLIKGCIDFFHIVVFLQEYCFLFKGIKGRLQPVSSTFLQQNLSCFNECCNMYRPLHLLTAILNVNHTLHAV